MRSQETQGIKEKEMRKKIKMMMKTEMQNVKGTKEQKEVTPTTEISLVRCPALQFQVYKLI